MLSGLRHRAVSSRNNQDCAVHLSSTGDHVLNIVSMAGAVNMSIVTGSRLILNVSSVDGNAALSLFGSTVNVGIILKLGFALEAQNLRNSGGQGGLTMVNVADGANVYMRFGSVKFFLCHWNSSFILVLVKFGLAHLHTIAIILATDTQKIKPIL